MYIRVVNNSEKVGKIYVPKTYVNAINIKKVNDNWLTK